MVGTILIVMLVMVGLAALPLVLLLGTASLAIFIWSWGRIGRYFINLARWLGDWRNFVPMTVLGTLFIIILVVLWRFLLPQLSIVWIAFLVLHLLVSVFCLFFAGVAWTLWFHQWFWPMYRKWLWSVLLSLFGQRRTRTGRVRRRARPPPRPIAEPSRDTRAPAEQRQTQKRSVLRTLWDLVLGKTQPTRQRAEAQSVQKTEQTIGPAGSLGATATTEPAVPRAKRPNPPKRAMFGTFWALILGKPRPKRQQTKEKSVMATEETLGPSGGLVPTAGPESGVSERASSATQSARKARPAKSSRFGSFWALMLGKQQPRKRQPRPTSVRTTEDAVGLSETDGEATGPQSSVSVRAASPSQPARREEPKKQSRLSSFWASMLGRRSKPVQRKVQPEEERVVGPADRSFGTEEAAKSVKQADAKPINAESYPAGVSGEKPKKRGFFPGVAQKAGEGVEWIRVRLNLD